MPKWPGRAFQTPKCKPRHAMTWFAFHLPSEKTKWLVHNASGSISGPRSRTEADVHENGRSWALIPSTGAGQHIWMLFNLQKCFLGKKLRGGGPDPVICVWPAGCAHGASSSSIRRRSRMASSQNARRGERTRSFLRAEKQTLSSHKFLSSALAPRKRGLRVDVRP